MSLNWNPSPGFLASSAHIGWATAVVLAGLHQGVQPWLLASLFGFFALVKEYWADLTWLEHDTVKGSTLDFVTYMLGLGLGNVSWFLSFWLALVLASIALVSMVVLDRLGFFTSIKSKRWAEKVIGT